MSRRLRKAERRVKEVLDYLKKVVKKGAAEHPKLKKKKREKGFLLASKVGKLCLLSVGVDFFFYCELRS
jgi:hypothetical protein